MTKSAFSSSMSTNICQNDSKNPTEKEIQLFPEDHWSRDFVLLEELISDFNRYRQEENNGKKPQQKSVQANWCTWIDPQRFPAIRRFTERFLEDEFIQRRTYYAYVRVDNLTESLNDFAIEFGKPYDDLLRDFLIHTKRFQSIVTVRNCETWCSKIHPGVEHWFQYTNMQNVATDIRRSLRDFLDNQRKFSEDPWNHSSATGTPREDLEDIASTARDEAEWLHLQERAECIFANNKAARIAVLRWIDLARTSDGDWNAIVCEELGIRPYDLKEWLNELYDNLR